MVSMMTEKLVPLNEWLPNALADLVTTVKNMFGGQVRQDQVLASWGFNIDTADMSDEDLQWIQVAQSYGHNGT